MAYNHGLFFLSPRSESGRRRPATQGDWSDVYLQQVRRFWFRNVGTSALVEKFVFERDSPRTRHDSETETRHGRPS